MPEEPPPMAASTDEEIFGQGARKEPPAPAVPQPGQATPDEPTGEPAKGEPRGWDLDEAQLGVFENPDDQPKRKITNPIKRQAPPKVDLSTIGANLPGLAVEAARKQTADQYQGLQSQMQQIDAQLGSIPHGTEEQREMLSDPDRARVDSLKAEKQRIDDVMRNQLPVAHNLRESTMKNEAANIRQLQRDVATQHPELASRILDMASAFPAKVQADPQTYDVLVRQVLGEQVLRDRQDHRIESAGSRAAMAGPSVGGNIAQYTEVASEDVDKLRRMGLKGNSLKRVVTNLEKA